MKSGARRAALRAAFAALIAGALAGSAVQLAAWIASGDVSFDAWWWASTSAAALAAALAAANAVRRSIGRRLTRVARLLDGRVHEVDFLARLPDMGEDEVGRIAASFNRMLARMTTLQGTVIDRSRELEATQRALALSEALGEKQRELEQRLTERALLFEVLRESASSHDLDRVLEALVTRVGPAMRMRHLAVVLRTEDARYIVRAAFGFDGGDDPVGSQVSRPSGVWSVQRGIVVVPDVERAPRSTAFWHRLPKDGSFAAVPIKHADQEIGFLVLTRSEDDPLGELEGRYLQAVADQAALAIHNAQLVARLERLSMHDELTGLPNRRLFAQHLERAMARADRYAHEVSVLVVDIDHFKQLNDRCGHPAGDSALRSVAAVLSDCLREVDTIARAGGEEFWVLLAHTGETGASEAAEKLRRRVASLEIEGADGQPLGYLSVSIGVATRRPHEGAHDVLSRADAALYGAKRAGRDRVASAA